MVVGNGWGVSNEDWEKGKKKREKEQALLLKVLEKERKVEEQKLRAESEGKLKLEMEEWDKKHAGVLAGSLQQWQIGPRPTEFSATFRLEQEINNVLVAQKGIFGGW